MLKADSGNAQHIDWEGTTWGGWLPATDREAQGACSEPEEKQDSAQATGQAGGRAGRRRGPVSTERSLEVPEGWVGVVDFSSEPQRACLGPLLEDFVFTVCQALAWGDQISQEHVEATPDQQFSLAQPVFSHFLNLFINVLKLGHFT